MAEKQQDLGKNPEEKHTFTLGDAVAEVTGGIALLALERTLAEGRMIHIPSLGLVITPDRELKEVKDLTDEERANNSHIG